MACEVCEHCQTPVTKDERVTIPEGFSYHKRCHKCYVCSETNLQNAEVFKGVIFCSSCSQRIFQGCSTARKTKTKRGRSRRTRSKSHRRLPRHDRERLKGQDRRPDSSRDGVIELAVLVGSGTDSEEQKKSQEKTNKVKSPTEIVQSDGVRQEPICKIMKNSTEIGTTTKVTQELLRQINCPIPDCKAKHSPQVLVPPRKHQSNKKKDNKHSEPIRNKPICSDLRMAELGVSTEIANMALRKKSEVPVIIKSNSRLHEKTSPCSSALKHESDVSGLLSDSSDWMDSPYSTVANYDTRKVMDRRLGSILRIPLKYFKKNILTRSSLISVLASSDDARSINLIRRLKHLLHEEVADHQRRGVRRLYSTINRRQIPYKLGWVDLVAKVSKLRDQNVKFCACSPPKRCKHYSGSHNYRCMRAQVMKLAGPTNSELACYRNKIKRFIAPQFLRNFIGKNDDCANIKVSQACGRSVRS